MRKGTPVRNNTCST